MGAASAAAVPSSSSLSEGSWITLGELWRVRLYSQRSRPAELRCEPGTNWAAALRLNISSCQEQTLHR
jgi:hypothetical protein